MFWEVVRRSFQDSHFDVFENPVEIMKKTRNTFRNPQAANRLRKPSARKSADKNEAKQCSTLSL